MSDDEEEHYTYSDDEDDDQTGADPGQDLAEAPRRERAESNVSVRSDKAKRLTDGAYSLIETAEVESLLEQKIEEVAELLELASPCAEVLLRHQGWNAERVMEAFVEDPKRMATKAGIATWKKEEAPCCPTPASGAEAVGTAAAFAGIRVPAAPAAGITCRICCCDVEAHEAVGAPCGHFFCDCCYGSYLTCKVEEGPTACLDVPCPEDKCTTVVPPAFNVRFLDAARLAKYTQFRRENFVKFSRDLRWCPAPGCTKVVRAGPCVAQVKCDPGGCGAAFCMRCGEEAHQPTNCKLLARWQEKCQNESETANWILANTKRCPKCQTRIEKNQGCNHMSCSQCKYDFCWMCMGHWTDHGSMTGGYYKCNKYDPSKHGDDDDSDQAKAKRELDRYLHYYKRFHGHDQAQKFAVKQLETTEKRMVELQESTQGSWIDVQFLKAANEMVIDCRRALKMTYIFGYYLATKAAKQRELFENLQEHLERFTEQLSELTERPLDQMDRAEIVNITRVTESFLHNLIVGAESGLDDTDLLNKSQAA